MKFLKEVPSPNLIQMAKSSIVPLLTAISIKSNTREDLYVTQSVTEKYRTAISKEMKEIKITSSACKPPIPISAVATMTVPPKFR